MVLHVNGVSTSCDLKHVTLLECALLLRRSSKIYLFVYNSLTKFLTSTRGQGDSGNSHLLALLILENRRESGEKIENNVTRSYVWGETSCYQILRN